MRFWLELVASGFFLVEFWHLLGPSSYLTTLEKKINTKNFTTISSKSEAAYPIYFEIKPTDVVSNVKILFKELGKKKPELYIKGDIIVKKFPIRKKIPVNYKIER